MAGPHQLCMLAVGCRGLRRRLLQGKSVQSKEHFCRVYLPAISLGSELEEPWSHHAMLNDQPEWVVWCRRPSTIVHEKCREAEITDGRMLATKAMGLHGATEGACCCRLLLPVGGCQSFSPHSAQTALTRPAVANHLLPVLKSTTRHDSACQWLASCSATAALRRCLFDALPVLGVGPS
jgi:hypothetical protein